MPGILQTNALQALFGQVFAQVFEDGQIVRATMTRQTGGAILPVNASPVAIKLQIDACTEAMRQQAGYTDDDVRMLILQSGAGAKPTTDDVIVARSTRWRIYGVTEDPARTYWEGRAVRQAQA